LHIALHMHAPLGASGESQARQEKGGEEVDEEYRGIMRLLAHVALLLLGWNGRKPTHRRLAFYVTSTGLSWDCGNKHGITSIRSQRGAIHRSRLGG